MKRDIRITAILLLTAFVFPAGGTALSGDKEAKTADLQETIDYLVEFIRASDVVFIRNDKEHTSLEAAEHMLKKYKYAKRKVKTPEDFIKFCASESTVSGKPYHVRLGDGTTLTSAAWLLAALEDYRKGGTAEAATGRLRFEMREFLREYGGCPTRNEDCVSVSVRYPEFIRERPDPALQVVETSIENMLLAPVYEGTQPGSYDELAYSFIEAYKKLQEDFPDYRHAWTLDREASVVYAGDSVLCISFTEMSFTGGAHPNSRRTFVNFEVSKGLKVALGDILVEGYEAGLAAVAERRFREVRGLKKDESLKDAGFWFEGGVFGLNDNFGITGSGLVFYFNDYEIAPHAMGPTEIAIPYGEISSLIRKGGIMEGVVQ
jgi:hypothetical protein